MSVFLEGVQLWLCRCEHLEIPRWDTKQKTNSKSSTGSFWKFAYLLRCPFSGMVAALRFPLEHKSKRDMGNRIAFESQVTHSLKTIDGERKIYQEGYWTYVQTWAPFTERRLSTYNKKQPGVDQSFCGCHMDEIEVIESNSHSTVWGANEDKLFRRFYLGNKSNYVLEATKTTSQELSTKAQLFARPNCR